VCRQHALGSINDRDLPAVCHLFDAMHRDVHALTVQHISEDTFNGSIRHLGALPPCSRQDESNSGIRSAHNVPAAHARETPASAHTSAVVNVARVRIRIGDSERTLTPSLWCDQTLQLTPHRLPKFVAVVEVSVRALDHVVGLDAVHVGDVQRPQRSQRSPAYSRYRLGAEVVPDKRRETFEFLVPRHGLSPSRDAADGADSPMPVHGGVCARSIADRPWRFCK